ncbi:Conserved_hypothetical protein [Hexamita inflata]|uniref:Uncharacterized protein n=1 Tax=Hexamita inflata TaxID=28002 RepID=A0AA86QA62_9EUKA|nr:Conserved hypothetical protein [Hexamita inflata]
MQLSQIALQRVLPSDQSEQIQTLKQMVIEQRQQILNLQNQLKNQVQPMQQVTEPQIIKINTTQSCPELVQLQEKYDKLVSELIPIKKSYKTIIGDLRLADQRYTIAQQQIQVLNNKIVEQQKELFEQKLKINEYKMQVEQPKIQFDLQSELRLNNFLQTPAIQEIKVPEIQPKNQDQELKETIEQQQKEISTLKQKLVETFNISHVNSIFELQDQIKLKDDVIKQLEQRIESQIKQLSQLNVNNPLIKQQQELEQNYAASVQELQNLHQTQLDKVESALKHQVQDLTKEVSSLHEQLISSAEQQQILQKSNAMLQSQLQMTIQKQANLLKQLQTYTEQTNIKQSNYEKIIYKLELKYQQKVYQLSQLQHEYNNNIILTRARDSDIFLRSNDTEFVNQNQTTDLDSINQQIKEFKQQNENIEQYEQLMNKMNEQLIEIKSQTLLKEEKQNKKDSEDVEEKIHFEESSKEEESLKQEKDESQHEKSEEEFKLFDGNEKEEEIIETEKKQPENEEEKDPQENQMEVLVENNKQNEKEEQIEMLNFTIQLAAENPVLKLKIIYQGDVIHETDEQESHISFEIPKQLVDEEKNFVVALLDMEEEVEMKAGTKTIEFDGNKILIEVM